MSAAELFSISQTLQHQSNLDLHREAMALAANYRRCEIELLDVISRIEAKQLYLEFDIASLFEYCVEMLGLSRHAAYNFISVARVSKKVPALADAIRSGRATVSKARKICSVITNDNAKEWIDLAVHCSSRIVERAVASANPRAAVAESLKYVSSDVLELKMAVSEEWSQLLSRTKDLFSQRTGRAVSSEEALFHLMQDFVAKNDPVAKANRAEAKQSEARRAADVEPISRARTRYIPSATLHAIHLRDQAQCTFVDRHSQRCSSRRWLQIHHREHFAAGGEHSLENLETLCWAHHCMKHRK